MTMYPATRRAARDQRLTFRRRTRRERLGAAAVIALGVIGIGVSILFAIGVTL